jgi:hypothetical protein
MDRGGTSAVMRAVAAAGAAALIGACSSASAPITQVAPSTATPQASGVVRFKAEVWADNWFAFYLGDTKVAEDSVPITTERSFNAETFAFEARYPLEMNLVIRDYIQDDTGLEYIGTPTQQIGDGGFIMQVTDVATGRVVAVSDTAMRCLVVHRAPLNPSCEKSPNPTATCQAQIVPEPAGWKSPGFDVSSWQPASVYTAAQVGPKEGYTTIRWDPSARLVWTSDLKLDNTLLCKLRVESK